MSVVGPETVRTDQLDEGQEPTLAVPAPSIQKVKRCAKCGKWRAEPEFPRHKLPNTDTYVAMNWCKSCYGDAISVGLRKAKARRMGDQAGAIIPGEGELQRTVRRGDKLMSVAQWAEKGGGALVLLNGEAVYQLEARADGDYVRILRRAPLSQLPPIALATFVYLRGKEEGVYYQ